MHMVHALKFVIRSRHSSMRALHSLAVMLLFPLADSILKAAPPRSCLLVGSLRVVIAVVIIAFVVAVIVARIFGAFVTRAVIMSFVHSGDESAVRVGDLSRIALKFHLVLEFLESRIGGACVGGRRPFRFNAERDLKLEGHRWLRRVFTADLLALGSAGLRDTSTLSDRAAGPRPGRGGCALGTTC